MPANPPDDETETLEKEGSEGAGALWLVLSSAKGLSRVRVAGPCVMTLGRSPECDVPLDDESVSRKHAALRAEGATVTLEDLGSHNGTSIAGQRLAPGTPVPLAPGTAAELGSVSLLLQRMAAPRASGTRNAAATGADEPVVADPRMKRLYALLAVIAPSPLHVILLGETGTGKEVFAAELHARSRRASGPFLKINCASLDGSLLESELFGHEKGAFTGATSAKPGVFEAADKGTLFLDEIGEMPLDTQAKLLRVIENGEVLRLGSVRPRRLDVRFVAATNRDLSRDVSAARFRADLHFRLNGFSIMIPSLRERPLDIVALAKRFLERATGRAPSLSKAAQAALVGHAWPGNVRELRTVVERAVVLAGDRGAIGAEHLLFGDTLAADDPRLMKLEVAAPRDSNRGGEKARIIDALQQAGGNQTLAAKALGVSRRTLINRLEEFGIVRPRKNQ